MLQNLLTLQPKAFGIDISDLSIKIAQLERARQGFRLDSFSEVALEKGIVEDGHIEKEAELVRSLRKGLEKIGRKNLHTPYIVVSLPEQKAFLQIVQLPQMANEEVSQALRFQVENYIPYSLDTVYLDHAIIPPFRNHTDHVDVLLASLPKEEVDSYLTVFEKAKLVPIALEIESLALSRALIENQVSSVPVLLCDIGASSTNLSIFSGHSLRLTTSIPISANHFTDAIQKVLQLTRAKAEEVKRLHGLTNEDNLISKRVREALLPVTTDFAEQVAKYLQYHESHVPHQHLGKEQAKIQKVMMCGGGANLPGFPEFLTEVLEVEVVLGNPWVNILSSEFQATPEFSLKDSLRYTTALGLALRGVSQSAY